MKRPTLNADENSNPQVVITRVALDDAFFMDRERLGRWIDYWWFAIHKKDPYFFHGTEEKELSLAIECGWLIRTPTGRLRLTGPKRERAWLSGARKTWWTYAIEAADQCLVKVGHTIDVERRLEQLQCASPHALVLRGSKKGDHEARLHRELRAERVSGEWFSLTEPVIAVLRREGLFQ